MANAKISDNAVFVPTTDITAVDGLAGFTGAGNVKIGGNDLVASLEENLDLTLFSTITAGQAGDVLTVDSGGIALQWSNPVTIDYRGIEGATLKVDLTVATTQALMGHNNTYTVWPGGVGVSCGQPVINYYVGGEIAVSEIGTLPSSQDVVGIARYDAAAAGSVAVITEGYATVRFTADTYQATDSIALDAVTTGTTKTLIANTTNFTDSGGAGDYSNNENYVITFDAGAGNTIDLDINDFDLEISGGLTFYYDRLGIQTSTDNVSWSNVSVAWMYESDLVSAPWAENNPISGGSTPGWIFPDSPATAGIAVPVTLTMGTRYVRFYFVSDGSAADPGWDIDVRPNVPYVIGGGVPVAEGSTIYLDTLDWTSTTIDDTSQIKVGYCAYSNSDDNSLWIRVIDKQTW
jgi:hypothetical protein